MIFIIFFISLAIVEKLEERREKEMQVKTCKCRKCGKIVTFKIRREMRDSERARFKCEKCIKRENYKGPKVEQFTLMFSAAQEKFLNSTDTVQFPTLQI